MTDAIFAAIAAEQQLLDPVVSANRDAVDLMLAPDFVEIGKSGRLWSRAEVLDEIGRHAPSVGSIETSDFAGSEVAPGLVLINYVSHAIGVRTRRASLWRETPAGWQIVFHQGTPVSD